MLSAVGTDPYCRVTAIVLKTVSWLHPSGDAKVHYSDDISPLMSFVDLKIQGNSGQHGN